MNLALRHARTSCRISNRSKKKSSHISTHAAGARRYFLIHDPRIPIMHLIAKGEIGKEEQFEINELYKDLGQEPIAPTEAVV